MNIAILPKLPDEDALAPKPRDRDAGAKAQAFEGEMKGAEGRARTKADAARETREAKTDETLDDGASVEAEPDEVEVAGPRDVLTLLAAVSQAGVKDGGRPERSRKAGEGSEGLSREWVGVTARPAEAEIETDALAPRSATPYVRDAAKTGGDVPRSRLVVARQETHFEPVLGEAVLVEIDEAASSEGQPSKERDIVRLLDTRAGEPSPFRSRDMRPERVSGDPSTVQAANLKQDGSKGASGAFQAAQSGPLSLARRNETGLPAERPDVSADGVSAAEDARPSERLATREEPARPGRVAPDTASVKSAEMKTDVRQMAVPTAADQVDTRSARARSEPVRSTERRSASDVDASAGRAEESANLDADSASPLIPADRKDQGVASVENRASKQGAVAQERPAPSFAAANEQRTQGLGSRESERLLTPAGVAGPSGSGAPSAVPAMSVQVAERIIDAFGGPGSSRPVDEAPSGSHLRLRAGGGALKTLVIQLQPENLGLLHVSMRLQDGQLMLEIAADKVETARMLGEDRAALRSLLEKAGFSLEDSSIVVAVREAGASASTSGARDGAASPDGRGAERGAGQGSGESERGRSESDGRDQPARRRAEEPVASRPKPAGTTFL